MLLLDEKCSRGYHRTAFADKEVGDVDMLEDSTEGGKIFHIFCFKENDYVMKIVASWMTLDELEGPHKNCNSKGRDGYSLVKISKHRQPFGLHFQQLHKVEDHNNMRHSPISLDMIWATKFWMDRNFAWYLSVTEVNTALSSWQLQNGGNIMPNLYFWGQLVLQCV